jgi:hypothetical protein
MNKTTILQNSFNENQNNAFINFQYSIRHKEIYNYDSDFNKFLNEIVLNILTGENISEILSNIKSEDVFYESFYLAYQLNNFDLALNYLHYLEYFDHYYVLDYFLEVY